MSYVHVSAKERHTLMYLLHLRFSYREIGRRLGRHHSTISREVKRNGRRSGWSYWDEYAQCQAQQRKRQPRHRRRRDHQTLYNKVIAYLRQGWSPDAISGWLRRHYKKRSRVQVCTETIYQWIYCDAQTGGTLYHYLASQHKKRKRQPLNRLKTIGISHRVGIEHRPDHIEKRQRLGHWEGDTVEGAKGCGGVVTLVERKSRFLLAGLLKDKQALTFSQVSQQALKNIPSTLCKTLTLDNGKENVLHQQISQSKKMKIYFTDPYSPWQRGTNEQTNGLLRRTFPKGTDFRKVSKQQLKKAVKRINQRPRKILNYLTPEEVFMNAVNGAL